MKLAKPISVLFLSAILLFPLASNAQASPIKTVSVKVNGELLKFSAAKPVLDVKAGRVLIPTRLLSAKMGLQYNWDKQNKKITLKNKNKQIVLKVKEAKALVDGQEFKLDALPEIIKDNTYVPLRFVTETMGYTVEWNSHTRTVTISKKTIEKNSVNKVSSLEADLFGQNAKNKIELCVEQNKDGLPIAWTLKIDGVVKVKFNAVEGLYSSAQFRVEDLDGDKKPEVLIYRQSSGSAGAADLQVYKPAMGSWTPIFTMAKPLEEQNRFEVKYLGNYKVSFKDKINSLNATIVLDEKQYKDIEPMLPNISTWVDPVADYIIKDQDNDGIKEIIAVQRVIGVSHPDTIGFLKTGFKLKNFMYKPVSLMLYSSNDKLLNEVKL